MKKNESHYETIFYNNDYSYDAFFIKAIHSLDQGVYFTNLIGTNYRFINSNLDGSRRMDTAVQSPQNSNLQLNLPFTYIGIGRSNNFVENFQIIAPIYLKKYPNYKLFTPIIPNSQLIISSEPDGSGEELIYNGCAVCAPKLSWL